jgi:hypothetical protein
MNKAFTQVGTFTPDKLIAGNQVPLLTKAITLAAGTGTLTRGSVISVSGTLSKGTTVDTTTTYDSVDGILTDDVTLSSTGTIEATIYISGEFNSDYITVGEKSAISNFTRELRTLGIYVK